MWPTKKPKHGIPYEVIQPSFYLLKTGLIILSSIALGLALVVYLLMEIRHLRQRARDVRRLILSAKLFPMGNAEVVRALWSASGRKDREIIEEILVDMCRSVPVRARPAVEEVLVKAGIVEGWIRTLQKGKTSCRVRASLKLGFVHQPRVVYALARAAEDRSPAVRSAVLLSLGRLRDAGGLSGLMHVMSLSRGKIPDLTLAAALAACAEKNPGSIVNLLRSPIARQRIIGAWALSQVADKTVIRDLLTASRDSEPEVRAKVARALALVPGPESSEALLRLARDPHWFVRVRALAALGAFQTPTAEAAALLALDDKTREVRYRAAFALRQIVGMKGELVARVLATKSREAFDSLISEWDRAGFLWERVAGLSTRNFEQFIESQSIVKTLIVTGAVRALAHLVLVFPDIKVRLRLVCIFLETSSPGTRSQLELLALAEDSRCDRRVAAVIRRAFASADARPATGVGTSPA